MLSPNPILADEKYAKISRKEIKLVNSLIYSTKKKNVAGYSIPAQQFKQNV